MLTKKGSIIINHLCKKEGYTTANELSSLLGVSTKTIKRAMSDINHNIRSYNVNVISTRGMGYLLEGSKKDISNLYTISQNYLHGINEDSIEKRIELFICLLINNEFISIEEISESLYLSISSTNKVFSKVKKILTEYRVNVKSKPSYGSYIEGDEDDIRKLMLDYSIKITSNEKIHSEIDNVFTKEILLIENVIIDRLKEQKIIISDKDFNILLSKIIISISRVRREKRYISNSVNHDKVNSILIIKEIVEEIYSRLNIEYDENEIFYICSHLNKIENYDIEEKVGKIIDSSLDDIYLISGIDYKQDKEFSKLISTHMKRLINRVFDNVRLSNPLTYQVKNNFPMEINLANFICKNIEKEFDISVSEEEKSFIAIHFAVASERIKKYRTKNICIICHYGIGTGQLIAEKLKQTMNDINIVGVYPARYLDLALDDSVDLIISTIKLENVKKEVIYVNNIFSEEIIDNIKIRIKEGNERRRVLANMFDRNAFFCVDASSKEDVFDIIGKKMIDRKYISESSMEKIIDRENSGTTETGNLVAIPHAIIDEDVDSVIGVGILNNPIVWDKQEVQLVFMVFLNKKQKQNAPIFRHLYNFIKDIGGVKSIINLRDFDKLIDTIS